MLPDEDVVKAVRLPPSVMNDKINADQQKRGCTTTHARQVRPMLPHMQTAFRVFLRAFTATLESMQLLF